jgi:hypothetical protein
MNDGDDTRMVLCMVLGIPHNQMAFALPPGRTKPVSSAEG